MNRWVWIFGGLFVLALGAVLVSPRNGTVLRADEVDFEWPFNVDSGRVDCQADGTIIFVANGGRYPLFPHHPPIYPYADLSTIVVPISDDPEEFVDFSPVTEIGRTHC